MALHWGEKIQLPNFHFLGFSAIPPPEVPQPSPSPLRHMAAPPMAVAPPVMQAEKSTRHFCVGQERVEQMERKDPKRLLKVYMDVSTQTSHGRILQLKTVVC